MAVHHRVRTVVFLFLMAGLVLAMPFGMLKPVDEASEDPSFLAFRDSLLTIIKSHDVAALEPLIDPKITYTYAALEPGWKGFAKKWKLDSPQSEFWAIAHRVLSHGGAFKKDDYFEAPYVSACWPKGLSPYNHGAITGQGVRVRSGPSASSAVVGELSYQVVQTADGNWRPSEWVKIQLPAGGVGFVSSQFFGTPIDYRAGFSKTSGKWRITMFVMGD